MDFYDRLKAFIKKEKLKITNFEAQMGFSNGSLSKALEQKRGIGSDRLETIFSKYPNLSADWLFKGQGEMLISTDSEIKNTNTTTPDDLRKTIAALEKVIYYNELVLDEYRDQLQEYKGKDENLEKQK